MPVINAVFCDTESYPILKIFHRVKQKISFSGHLFTRMAIRFPDEKDLLCCLSREVIWSSVAA